MSATVDQNSSSATEQAGDSLLSKQTADIEYTFRQTQQVQDPQYIHSDYQPVQGSTSVMDSCVPGYYTPYLTVGGTQSQPVGDNNIMWTAAEPVTYVSGYDVGSNYISGSAVYRGVDYPQHLSYGWFPGVDYGEWGTGFMVDGNRGYAENYYYVDGVVMENCTPVANDPAVDGEVKVLQQSLEGMGLEDGSQQFGYTMSPMPSMGVSTLGQNGASWTLAANQYSHLSKVPRSSHNGLDVGTWNAQPLRQGIYQSAKGVATGRGSAAAVGASGKLEFDGSLQSVYAVPDGSQPVLSLDSLHGGVPNVGQYNPNEFGLNVDDARFFIIKSYSEDDVHRSIKYNIWCSTEYGNKRLDAAFQERSGHGPIYLFFSVNGSGHFCGVAEMTSPVDYDATSSIWAQSKWKGQFQVRWVYVKDVPNSQLRHIKLENNENKPVTNSRDTQEVPPEKGKQVMRIIHQYRHTTSIFDDFSHYEQRHEDERRNKENYRK